VKLRRLRIRLTILFGVVGAVLALVPLTLWYGARSDAIEAEFDEQLVDQMVELQRGWIVDDRDVGFEAWLVNVNDGWDEPFADTDLEPPLFTWVNDAGEWPSYRSFSVDDTTYGGYIRPMNPGEAFVTVADSGWRDDNLAALQRRALMWALVIVASSLGLGWLGAGLALGPTRRMLDDQQGFLADAAHEMRTPLAVITASSSQALARDRTSTEYVRSLSEIRSAAERASTGVNEMLDLVRFDSGQAIPRLAPLRLDLLAEEVAASTRADGVEIVALPTDPVVVHVDMALVRQALDNIVRNGVRRSTRVELVTTSEQRKGVVRVIDNGAGFDPATLDSVFDRYRRGDQRGEAGIGLTIVKTIVEANGGDVCADNVTDDAGAIVGARITIRLPLASTPG